MPRRINNTKNTFLEMNNLIQISPKKANNSYNSLAFLAQTMIPHIDNIVETDKPKFALKKALKDTLRECEKITNEHYQNFANFGIVEDATSEKGHQALDIYTITAKAYDSLFSRSANEIVSICALVERLEKDGVKLNDIAISYEPIEL